ncbi:hypothetical protein Mapa_008129 [Marchantia paleacea]|nr:hypothetical protein Mapa_008129 [Marchantia paleacea]
MMGTGVPLPQDLKEFSTAKYWDSFFKARGGKPFEWYGEWKDIGKLFLAQCGVSKDSKEKVLIPGCGNSTLSADMYDAGFTDITNIDFSRVVISEMLRQHVRSRPRMRWLVMDMTKMQFSDSSFDVVVDKGGLDAILGEPEDESTAGVSLLSEVKRVLRPNGRLVVITLAQQHVIELLLQTFREGWHLSVYALQLTSSSPSSLQPFMVIAKKETRAKLPLVSLDLSWQGASNKFQMEDIVKAVDNENVLRSQGLCEAKAPRSPEINPKDSYENLHPGRRLTMNLGSHRSQYNYTAVIMDAKEDIIPEYRCAVFLVPKGRAHEWLFSSVEGQWQVAESTKAGRLILVALAPNQYVDNILNVKDDLSPLVKCLLPLDCRESSNVPYMTQGDGISTRNILDEVESPLTGAMLVEDVVLSEENTSSNKSSEECFRRLVFRRNPNLIQSEALLIRVKTPPKAEDKGKNVGGTGRKHANKKKGKPSKDAVLTQKQGEELRIDHSYLASPYHGGMIAALILISNNLENWLGSKQQIRSMIVGLGAGLLPMFVHNHLPFDDIQIVELDPVVGDVAKKHFGFIEDERMKLVIGDGIDAVQDIADAATTSSSQNGIEDAERSTSEGGMNGTSTIQESCSQLHEEELTASPSHASLKKLELNWEEKPSQGSAPTSTDSRLHVLIVDADSEDPSSGLSCPPQEFIEDKFLIAARGALAEGGVLIINVVSRATAHHVTYVAQLKKYFVEVYDIEVNEDVNRVLIALPQPRNKGASSDIMDDLSKLEKIVTQFAPWRSGPDLKEIVKSLKRLK